MVNGEDYSWNVIVHRGASNWGRYEEEPIQLNSWHRWTYSGKGPRWCCWECRGYFRQLYSNKELPTYTIETTSRDPFPKRNYLDNSYGLLFNIPGRGTQWERFDWRWYCKTCLKKTGVLW